MERPTASHGLGSSEQRQPRPATPTYDEIPRIEDVVIPIAGIEYAWVLPESIHVAQGEYNKDGLPYTQIQGLPLVLVANVPLALMGRGRAIRGAPNQATTCPVFVDENAAVRIDQARKDQGLPALYEAYYPQAKELTSTKKATSKE